MGILIPFERIQKTRASKPEGGTEVHITNGDRIRSMSDEELAEFVIGVLCYIKLPYMEVREKALRDNELIDWLKQEEKDDKG